jgi:hypothetical protein
MKGFNILDELYTPVGNRSIACTLVLENGYEITEAYCIDMEELINEDSWKQRAFKLAFARYMELKNAVDRQALYQILPRGEKQWQQRISMKT